MCKLVHICDKQVVRIAAGLQLYIQFLFFMNSSWWLLQDKDKTST
jgi:hypothetical protein